MKYGQLPATKYTQKNGIAVGQIITIDFEALKKAGVKKRGWDGEIDFKITHIYDTYCVGLTSSNQSMQFPFSLLTK